MYSYVREIRNAVREKSGKRQGILICPICMNPVIVMVQPKKTSPYKTERLLMGHKESNQTNQTQYLLYRGSGL